MDVIMKTIVRTSEKNNGGSPTSMTSAHHSSTTVATFRSWQGCRVQLVKLPVGLPNCLTKYRDFIELQEFVSVFQVVFDSID